MKLFLLVLCLVPLVSARSTKGRETDACIADFLKSQGLLGDEFGTDQPLSPLCSSIAQVTKNAIVNSVGARVAEDDDMRKETTCIMNSLKKSDIGNLLLVVYVYETSPDIDAAVKAEKEKTIQSEINKATMQAFIACQAENKFGQIFDEMINEDSSSSEEEDPKEDYCTRKHVVDNKLIALEGVTLDLNPKSVDLKNIDCHLHYQKALDKAEKELVQALMDEDSSEEKGDDKSTAPLAESTCLLDVVRSGKYIDQMLQYDYIKELNLSPPKMNAMRKNFIAVMTRLAQSASQCFL